MLTNTAGLSEAELEEQFRRRDFIMVQKSIEGTYRRGLENKRKEGIEIGIEKGVEIGVELNTTLMARKMKAEGFDIAVIAKITGLSEDVITQLD